LLAGIRATNRVEQERLADADLERAVSLGANQAEPLFARAFRRVERGDTRGARADLDRARAVAGGDPRLFQLELLLALERKDLAAAERSAFELSRRAKTAAQLGLLASYYAGTGKPRTAVRFARYGIRTDSTCWRCFEALGEADAALGRTAPAAVAMSTAMHLLSEDDPRRKRLRARLAELMR
jgi:predicted Zn-dependent protease